MNDQRLSHKNIIHERDEKNRNEKGKGKHTSFWALSLTQMRVWEIHAVEKEKEGQQVELKWGFTNVPKLPRSTVTHTSLSFGCMHRIQGRAGQGSSVASAALSLDHNRQNTTLIYSSIITSISVLFTETRRKHWEPDHWLKWKWDDWNWIQLVWWLHMAVWPDGEIYDTTTTGWKDQRWWCEEREGACSLFRRHWEKTKEWEKKNKKERSWNSMVSNFAQLKYSCVISNSNKTFSILKILNFFYIW